MDKDDNPLKPLKKRSRCVNTTLGRILPTNLRNIETDGRKEIIGLSEDMATKSYVMIKTLGEGAFGEVYLVANKKNRSEIYAVKCTYVCDEKLKDELYTLLRKETLLMKILKKCPNIIKCYGLRFKKGSFQMFLEYADRGDLFDFIEIDKGMNQIVAHSFFQQLINAVEFMHDLGIAHRDIKPENLLIFGEDTLKVCDFGLASVFRLNNTDVVFSDKCGTMQYCSPQVALGSYRGDCADMWSCGVVLFAMITGTLPWNRPSKDDGSFMDYLKNPIIFGLSPWNRIKKQQLELVTSLLCYNETDRITASETKMFAWFIGSAASNVNGRNKGTDEAGEDILKTSSKTAPKLNSSSFPRKKKFFLNQAEEMRAMKSSFSQPMIAEYFESGSQNDEDEYDGYDEDDEFDPISIASRRMTRFTVSVSVEKLMKMITERLESWFTKVQRSENVMRVNGPRNNMSYLITAYQMHKRPKETVLVDCCRSHGCGLDFKRAFLALKEKLNDVIVE